jgi:PKD repeat protein
MLTIPRSPRAALRRHLVTRSRGQSLVEFALVLPILLFLTLTALDFGRVYLGYVNLQNMARIAANFAANNPTAWAGTGKAQLEAQLKYQNQILADASASNCSLPIVGGTATAPGPTFTDWDSDGRPGLGDTAKVSLSCDFGVITPFIASVVGGRVQVSASSVFPVKTGMSPTSPGAATGPPPTAAFTGNGTVTPNSISGTAPFTVVFRDTSGGSPTGWTWKFPDDGSTSIAQDPPPHVFLSVGTWLVTMEVTNIWGKTTTSMGVTVTNPGVVDFVSNVTSGTAPLNVTFTDRSTVPGSAYAWTFGTGQGTGSGPSASHTYNVAGNYTVTLTVTYPTGPQSRTYVNMIHIDAPLCQVPHLDGIRRNSALSVWQSAPAKFTGIVVDGPGAPSGNYVITTQSLTALSYVPCTSNVMVNRP